MIELDHLTVIAPTLVEGVAHVRDCLDLDVPFGTRHEYMGTHNHRLQLGSSIYLEIIAIDPEGIAPDRPRWFGLDDRKKVKADWDDGRRLRGWVANTSAIDLVLSTHGAIFGEKVALPMVNPSFAFAIPADGSLPLDGVAPSLIDHWGDPTPMASIPDLGARLRSFILEHPRPAAVEALYDELCTEGAPVVVEAPDRRYRALVETPSGLKELT